MANQFPFVIFMSPFSIDNLIEKVKLKLNFIDYDGSTTIPDDVVRKHLETAKILIDSVFDIDKLRDDKIFYLYEECLTEYAKYLIMVSWASNAVDLERTPNIWKEILANERRILKSLLLRLIGDPILVDQILGEEDFLMKLKLSIPKVTNSYNLLTRFFTK